VGFGDFKLSNPIHNPRPIPQTRGAEREQKKEQTAGLTWLGLREELG